MSSQFPTQAPALGSEQFAPTEAVGLRPNGESLLPQEYPATQLPPGSNAEADAALALALGGAPMVLDDDLDFTHSDLYAVQAEDMSTDPELEEAAIRFANGDDEGAEKGLLDSLRTPGAAPELALSWTAALLDLYRATNNPMQFELAVLEFGARLGKAAPTWAPLGASSPAQSRTSADMASRGASDGGLIWQCPAILDKTAMESLRVALSTNPTPWNVGWSRLNTIAADAMPLLSELFSSLCEEPVALRFAGAEVLVQQLRHKTPSGDRSVDKTWWQLRLDALRAMHLIDEFELAALDYCVTLEVSPPAWREAQCRFETAESASSVTTPSRLTASPASSVDDASSTSELRGEIQGDATRALASLGEVNEVGALVVVSCRNLVRVDFSAAGGILNWVALRQAEGGQVQFTDVHRLVAAFFIVIGINEHGRVIPRPV
jgi:hypothetical protein